MDSLRQLQLMVVMLLLLLALPVQATSVRQLHFDEVATTAEVIFVGAVIASEPQWNSAGTRIHTFVTFRLDEVLKDVSGKVSGNSLTLRFAGGTIGNTSLVYEQMVYPQVGEQGIYFVETLAKPLVNPLVGWSQGHFKTTLVDGVERTRTAAGQPVDELLPIESSSEEAARAGTLQRSEHSVGRAGASELSRGHATGLQVGKDASGGMSKASFVDAVRARLRQLQE